MLIWVVGWNDGYDSGWCFVAAFGSEPEAKNYVDQQNQADLQQRMEYSYEEYALGTID